MREARIRQQRPTEGAGPFRPRRPFAPRRQSRLQCPVPFDSERGSPRPLARGLSSGVSCEYMLASSCVNLGRLQRLTEHRRDHQLVGKGRRDDATKLHIHKPREPRQALVCGAGCSDHTLAFERHSHEASLSCGEVWLMEKFVVSTRFGQSKGEIGTHVINTFNVSVKPPIHGNEVDNFPRMSCGQGPARVCVVS